MLINDISPLILLIDLSIILTAVQKEIKIIYKTMRLVYWQMNTERRKTWPYIKINKEH